MIKLIIEFEELPNGEVEIRGHTTEGFATTEEEAALKKLLPMFKNLHKPRVEPGGKN